jgi:hypothetical protein
MPIDLNATLAASDPEGSGWQYATEDVQRLRRGKRSLTK